jgi:arabinan endo-1,5-alpha-L-arabinosidase
MRFNQLVVFAGILAIVAAAPLAQATQIYSNNYSAASPGTLNDKNGLGTGFTTRLSGTGSAIAANDLNLVLDRRAGWLRMTSVNADINGQRNNAGVEFIGIDLGSLGFTGNEDFIVSASFVNVPTNFPTMSNSFDQFGAFVGEDSLYLTRAGGTNYNFFGAPEFEAFGDNIFNGVKVDDRFFGPLTGNAMNIEISRVDGVWKHLVNGADRTPLFQPNFLDASNLVAGVWLYSTDDSQFIVDLTHFQVTVIPEPSSAILLLSVLGVACVRRSK